MKMTICGSIKFSNEMKQAKSDLEKLGHEVLIPLSADLNHDKEFWKRLREENLGNFATLKRERMKGHFDKIRSSDAILVLNYDKNDKQNYIGPNTFLEMAVAFDNDKRIFLLNPISSEDINYEELISLSPTVINGNFSEIK